MRTIPASAAVTLPAPGTTGPLAFSPTLFGVDLGPAGKTYYALRRR
jgi:hypothetical protein